MANSLGAVFGGGIIAALAWYFQLKMDAPTSVEGTTAFGFGLTVVSVVLVWLLIFLRRCFLAPAQLDAEARARICELASEQEALKGALSVATTTRLLAEFDDTKSPPCVAHALMHGIKHLYVRVRVTAMNEAGALGCVGHLVNVVKLEDGKFVPTPSCR